MRSRVFDFRVRLAPGDEALDGLLAAMDAHGVDCAAVTAGGIIPLDQLAAQIVYGGFTRSTPDNERVLAACRAAGGRLLPIYFANPHEGAAHYRTAAASFRGVELSPAVHGVDLTDPRSMEIVRVAAEVGHSVYVVCLGRPGARTTDLVELAREFPGTTFVLGHCGSLAIDTHAINQIAPYPTIMAETSGCFTAVARHAIARLGAGRVLFGTEYPLQHASVELAKYTSLELPASVWAQVAWHNAIRVLGEPNAVEYPSREDPS